VGERPEMDARRCEDERRRCSECGRKFKPKPSAKKHQRTCGTLCRLKRRARLARERYQVAPLASREAARNRKRKSRSNRRAGPEPPRESLPAEVSGAIAEEMASLLNEGWLERREVEKALHRVARRACARGMSRAGLGADSSVVPGG
jgi:hypothetical protein